MGSPAPAEAPAQPGASPRGIQAGGKSHPAQQLLHPASEPLSPAGEGAADAPFQTGALLPSSEEATPAHSGDQGPALSAEEAERRKRRRERWEAEVEAGHRWDLHRRLADISTDVEWLAREVERVRSELEVPLPPISELPEAERTQLEAVRRRRLNELLGNHCKKALAHITSHKWSWPFNAPVDLRQYPDYADMVARPMDFGTVRRRIDAGAYRHPDDFLADVRLVFDNARLYNKPGSDVHVMANTLQERFEEKYAASVAPRVAEEGLVTQQEEDEARRRHLEATSRGDTQALEQQCTLLVKYIDEVQALVADARSAAAALCKPVSRQEKEALVASLNVLPQPQFELAVGLVMSHHPGLQAYDDFAFDLDALDALALRQMRSFVRACEASNAEAERSGAQPATFSWPQLLLGAGLRPYRLPSASKRQKRRQAAAASPGGQQQEVKKEEQECSQQPQQQGDPPLQQQQQQPSARMQGQAISRDVVDDVAPPPSMLTPEEVAAAAAAAGLISPTLPLVPAPSELPAAGSAVGPAPLVAAVPLQQQQQAQAGMPPAAAPSPAVASSAPVAPLPAAAQASQQPAGSKAGQPTAAQRAAVANAGPQQQQLLAQMHSLLSKVQMSHAAAAQQAARVPAPKPAGQQQQQQQDQPGAGGK